MLVYVVWLGKFGWLNFAWFGRFYLVCLVWKVIFGLLGLF